MAVFIRSRRTSDPLLLLNRCQTVVDRHRFPLRIVFVGRLPSSCHARTQNGGKSFPPIDEDSPTSSLSILRRLGRPVGGTPGTVCLTLIIRVSRAWACTWSWLAGWLAFNGEYAHKRETVQQVRCTVCVCTGYPGEDDDACAPTCVSCIFWCHNYLTG
ncbi:hypothetical protein LX32DRAFT_638494 [Colletotrichum zoysiae]|uniref:Uncharacterized protein n=1 Tax=Colletotrichum zoysiae TaxID=1216348 RepID=A0AAD9HJ89_9PEZI|nr:hypothetical protein LX32DRAFT_638494 [Colletotrichum zoysiae]